MPDQIGLCIWSPPEREEYLAFARTPESLESSRKGGSGRPKSAPTRFARSPEFGVPDEIVGKIQREVRKNLSNQEAKVKGNIEGRRLKFRCRAQVDF